MFKHECVECLKNHNLNCIWNISFLDRLFGTKEVKYCPEYIKNMEKVNKK